VLLRARHTGRDYVRALAVFTRPLARAPALTGTTAFKQGLPGPGAPIAFLVTLIAAQVEARTRGRDGLCVVRRVGAAVALLRLRLSGRHGDGSG
jgi:hypothetical protein